MFIKGELVAKSELWRLGESVAVGHVRDALGPKTVSERRACRMLWQARSRQRCQSVVTDEDPYTYVSPRVCFSRACRLLFRHETSLPQKSMSTPLLAHSAASAALPGIATNLPRLLAIAMV